MLCRAKPGKVRRRLRRYLFIVLAAVIMVVTYFEVAVRVLLTEVIRAEMRTAAEEAVNEAVNDFLTEYPDIGEKLVGLHFTDGGGVTALTSDAALINRAKAEISRRSQENLDSAADKEGLSVPLGSFTGVVFLSEIGPDIPLCVNSRSTVACSFESSFESAGINQTVHHIRLIVDVDVIVYDPFRIYKGIHISSDYEIAQTVIVGSVPTYGGVVTY